MAENKNILPDGKQNKGKKKDRAEALIDGIQASAKEGKTSPELVQRLIDNYLASAKEGKTSPEVVKRLLVGLQVNGLNHETLGISEKRLNDLINKVQSGDNSALYELIVASRGLKPNFPLREFVMSRLRGENAEQVKPKKPKMEEQKRS